MLHSPQLVIEKKNPLDARVSTWKFEYTWGKNKLKCRWMMWLKCENVKCKRGDVHMLVKRRINCEYVHFNCDIFYFFLLLKISLVKKQISCDFLAISFSFHMWIVWSTRERQSHYEFVSFSCENVHSTFQKQPITWQYSIRVWKCDCDESRLMRSVQTESKPKHWAESFQDL